MSKARKPPLEAGVPSMGYEAVLSEVAGLLEAARRASARAVNSLMTATYWEVGRRIVELEQGGREQAEYGKKLIERLSADLSARFGRGFGYVNLTQMRKFYLLWPLHPIVQTPSEESSLEHAGPELASLQWCAEHLRLPWSHYVRLLSVESPDARRFYEAEALRAGWTVRQLDRQVSTKFYERTLLSRNKAAMLRRAEKPRSGEAVTPAEELKGAWDALGAGPKWTPRGAIRRSGCSGQCRGAA